MAGSKALTAPKFDRSRKLLGGRGDAKTAFMIEYANNYRSERQPFHHEDRNFTAGNQDRCVFWIIGKEGLYALDKIYYCLGRNR